MLTFYLPERFWQRIERRNGCWIWTGIRSHFGHGIYSINDRQQRAHRVTWQCVHGAIPDGLCVCHRCDNPPCCNPDHLFLGTHAENMADMTAKGRQYRPTGDKHHRRKLSSAKAEQIKRRLSEGERGVDLAREFGVHRNTIYACAAGRSWAQTC